MITNKAARHYLKQIKKKFRRMHMDPDFFHTLCQQIEDFVSVHPQCTLQKLNEELGTPEDIFNDYMEEREGFSAESISKSRKKFRLFIVLLFVVLLACGAFLYKSMQPTPVDPPRTITYIDKSTTE